MISEAQINRHDRTVDTAIEEITALVVAYWAGLLNSLTEAGSVPSIQSIRSTVASVPILRGPVQDAVRTVLISSGNLLNLENSSVLVEEISRTTADIIVADTKAMAEGAASEIISSLLAGAALGAAFNSIRSIILENQARSVRAIAPVIIHSDAAYGFRIMRDGGVERFTYRGGIVAGTREFCAAHNNKTYTEREIRSIWSSQTWGGKAPGDPFVTRGGYNCRHRWVPEEE